MLWRSQTPGFLNRPLQGILLALALLLLPQGATAAEPIVVVELFTSQGCAACPKADKVLAGLAEDTDLLALSWPVDYWDYLGWKDTFAQPANSQRQEDYNAQLGKRGVYTPEMVVNGREHMVGSRGEAVRRLIRERKEQGLLPLDVRITGGGRSAAVEIGPGKVGGGEATVWLVMYDEERVVDIKYGDNRGRSLHYANIVLGTESVGRWQGTQTRLPLDLDAARKLGAKCVAVIVQEGKTGPILGAAKYAVN